MAFAGQKLVIGRENDLATFEADQRKNPVCCRALVSGAGTGSPGRGRWQELSPAFRQRPEEEKGLSLFNFKM